MMLKGLANVAFPSLTSLKTETITRGEECRLERAWRAHQPWELPEIQLQFLREEISQPMLRPVL